MVSGGRTIIVPYFVQAYLKDLRIHFGTIYEQ